MDESTSLTITVGLGITIATALVWLGVTWARLTAQIGRLTEVLSRLERELDELDKAHKAEVSALSAKHHAMANAFADHTMRITLLERELGVVEGPIADRRTPRPHLPSGRG